MRAKRKTPRERLTEHLEALGYTVRRIATPNNFQQRFEDLFRWEAFCKKNDLDRVIVCWSSVTEAARYGIEVDKDGYAWPKVPTTKVDPVTRGDDG